MDMHEHESPMTLISRRRLLGGGLAAGGLWLVGCSNSDSGGARSTATSGGGGTETVERVANLRIGTPTDISPPGILRFTPGNQPIRRTVFDVVVDRNQNGEYVPALASEWNLDDAGTTLVITLRDDVTFHSGRPFTADDVVFLVDQALAEGSGAQVASLLRRGQLTKSGEHELTVTFEAPFASYLDAFSALPVVDSETFGEIESGQTLVGTGPFVWKGWTPGSSFEMERYEDYWGGDVAFDSLTFRVIPEPQASLAAMRSGDLDMVAGMVARDASTLADRGFELFQSPGFDFYVGLNTSVAPLDDVRVRQAIAMALDRDRIVDQVFSGLAEATSIPWSSDTPGVTDDMVNRWSYDVEAARALIEEAGATGAEIAISPSPQEPVYDAVAEIVQFGLTEIGLRPRPVAVDAAEFPKKMQAGGFEGLWVAVVGLTSLGPTTTVLAANPLMAQKNSHNYDSPEYKELVAGVVDAASEDEHASAVADLTEHLLDQAFHNSVVQSSTVVVAREGTTGVGFDATLALMLTGARLDQ